MEKSLTLTTLVLGGASSGKSLFAENLIISTPLPRTYIATSQAWDDEMQAKIDAHKVQRGPDWVTVEAPIALDHALKAVPRDNIVLIDCLTMWLTNLMLAEADIDAATDRVLKVLQARSSPTVIVSNEVGQGIIPDNKMARQFVAIQGRANQRFAAACQAVAFVTAGLPIMLKGTL